ncbi:MAG: glycoside hydrolase family 95 protein, partial [Clostridia bacterium]|nr:glycoside hydrolase family 95 protein [Clostridia bacterium]
FVSFPDDVACIRYVGCLPTLELTMNGLLKSTVSAEEGLLLLEGEAPEDGRPRYVDRDGDHVYREEPERRGMRYGVGARVKTDGRVTCLAESIRVENAAWLEVYVTTKTSFAGYKKHPYLEGKDYKKEIKAILERAMERPYEELKARHVADHSALFSRVEFELEGGREDLPTDERLIRHATEPDAGLQALIYQFGRYLTIASSREGSQPTNLQGIWNILPKPPWSCNYTTNINTEMNYWGTIGANLAECCEPLHRFIYELSEAGQETARRYFGADGFCVNHNTDLWRITHPVGNWNPKSVGFGYFPLAGVWLCRHLYEYYLDTKDEAFLKGAAFDAIMGSARFCDSMLRETDGALYFTPATSPENRLMVDGERAGFSKHSAMYQSLVRDIFEICIAVCDATGRENDYARYLEQRLKNIPWLETDAMGCIMEWDEDRVEADLHHRHISQLYSFYPAKKVTDPKLMEALRTTLEIRGDEGTGWSCVWKICLWAQLGDGERALKLFDMLMRICTETECGNLGGGLYKNLLCACPPFQIDGNFGIVAAVHELLVQQKGDELLLLPALPKLWKNGRIKGLRVGGKTLEMEWKDGKVVRSVVE